MKTRLLGVLLVFAAQIWMSQDLYSAPEFIRAQTFLNPTPAAGDSFGISVATAGGYSVIGAPGNTVGSLTRAGTAYVFDNQTGQLAHTWDSQRMIEDDNFGRVVAASNSLAIVGSPNTPFGDQVGGAAHLFDLQNGDFLRTFNNPMATTGDFFGRSVDISGNRVLVGAPSDDTQGQDRGRAFLFHRDGSLLQTFENPLPGTRSFGERLAISGNRVLVSGYRELASSVGQVHLFDADSGNLIRTFTTPAFPPDDRFGASVEILGDKIAIAAPSSGGGLGTVHLFDESGLLQRSFTNPVPVGGGFFGGSLSGYGIALDGDRLLVQHEATEGPTLAHLFDSNTGDLLFSFPNVIDFHFGSVSLDNETILVGQAGNNTGGDQSGVALLFEPVPEPISVTIWAVLLLSSVIYRTWWMPMSGTSPYHNPSAHVGRLAS